jgi:hypothetical protein
VSAPTKDLVGKTVVLREPVVSTSGVFFEAGARLLVERVVSDRRVRLLRVVDEDGNGVTVARKELRVVRLRRGEARWPHVDRRRRKRL